MTAVLSSSIDSPQPIRRQEDKKETQKKHWRGQVYTA